MPTVMKCTLLYITKLTFFNISNFSGNYYLFTYRMAVQIKNLKNNNKKTKEIIEARK